MKTSSFRLISRPIVTMLVAGGVLALLSPVVSNAVVRDGMAPATPWKVRSRSARKKNPISATAQSVNLGKQVFARECASCHGAHGLGDGKSGRDLDPLPTNLTTQLVAGQSDGAMFFKVTTGRSPMPAFKGLLTDEDRWNVINYIRTLAPQATVVKPKYAAPESQRVALSAALRASFLMNAKLAVSDAAGAQSLIAEFAKSVEQLEMTDSSELDASAKSAWSRDVSDLSAKVKTMASAEASIASLRNSYRAVSASLVTMLKDFGHALSSEALVFNADSGSAQGVWAQAESKPQNPFGTGSTVNKALHVAAHK